MEKLLKFRALEPYDRVEEILSTGNFWFSKFCTMNDPMEGVYAGSTNFCEARHRLDAKLAHLMCSFSRKEALHEPLLWGHYANGYKGIAVEVEVKYDLQQRVHRMRYVNELPIQELPNETPINVLTSKFENWKYECESRIIVECVSCTEDGMSVNVGTISRVYIGLPYANTANAKDIASRVAILRKYFESLTKVVTLLDRLGIDFAGITCSLGSSEIEVLDANTVRAHLTDVRSID